MRSALLPALVFTVAATGAYAAGPATPPAAAPATAVVTTDGAIATGNLEAQLAAIERQGATPAALTQLVPLLVMRGQFFGRLADYERAVALAATLTSRAPRAPESFLVRAEARATLHQFDAARADLAHAEALGAGREATAPLRAVIAQALGHYAEARALRRVRVAARPTTRTLAGLATLDAEAGDLAAAERGFAEARARFVDVSPFPYASLELQEGLMRERQGRLAEARALFADAVARLPGYAPATSHLAAALAATGERARAITLLEALVRRSDDPEPRGQLAALYAEAGRHDEAAAARAQARARFEELLERQPAAFADHAARFYLATGEARRALGLARANLARRQTGDAYQLTIDAALAAGEPAAACGLADRAAGLAYVAPTLRVALVRAFRRCGAEARVAAELAAAGVTR